MQPGPNNPPAPSSRGMVAFSVSFYMITAIIMIMVNKAVLNSFALPLTFLFLQIVLAVVLLHVSQLFGWLTLPELHPKTCKDLWPLIGINVVGLAGNTITLQLVDASFYQVARALVLPFTVILSWVVLHQPSSSAVLLCCLVVCGGFVTGVMGELSSMAATSVGILYGVFSSATTAAHAIIIKKSLDTVANSTIDLVYYNNVLSALVFFPICILSGELSEAIRIFSAEAEGEEGADVTTFLLGVLVTGFFGFLINIAGFLQVKVTSPITHCISAAVRGVLQTIVAVIMFGDIVTTSRAWGILLILIGGMAYTVVRDREMKRKWAEGSTSSASPFPQGWKQSHDEEDVALTKMEKGENEEATVR